MYATHVPWHFTRARMIPCSSCVKSHARDVLCVFHGILHVKEHVHTLRETWSMQTRDVNLEYLCRVSLRVHVCKSEVINERYCILLHNLDLQNFTTTLKKKIVSPMPRHYCPVFSAESYINACLMQNFQVSIFCITLLINT